MNRPLIQEIWRKKPATNLAESFLYRNLGDCCTDLQHENKADSKIMGKSWAPALGELLRISKVKKVSFL